MQFIVAFCFTAPFKELKKSIQVFFFCFSVSYLQFDAPKVNLDHDPYHELSLLQDATVIAAHVIVLL